MTYIFSLPLWIKFLIRILKFYCGLFTIGSWNNYTNMHLFYVPYLFYCRTNTSPSHNILRNPTYGELLLITHTKFKYQVSQLEIYEILFNSWKLILTVCKSLLRPHNTIVDKDDLPGRLINDLVSSCSEVPDTPRTARMAVRRLYPEE